MTYIEKLPFHPMLGRHVRHDERSLQFLAETAPIRSVVFARHTPILDQGQVGKCTAEAMGGLLGTDPFFTKVPAAVQDALATQPTGDKFTDELYHEETELEDPSAPWPPNDQGGSGLEISAVAKTRGYISAYTHALGLTAALGALSASPGLIGIPWYNSMFEPRNGVIPVKASSGLAGGHELLVRELDVKVSGGKVTGWVVVDNSWGTSWSEQGRGKLSVSDFGKLLAAQGDVTIPVPA
jgi:hypothetical protein